MITTKKVQVKERVALFTFGEKDLSYQEKWEVAALAILTGMYNPMRQHTTDGAPMNIEELKGLKRRFDEVINDTVDRMGSVDVANIRELK